MRLAFYFLSKSSKTHHKCTSFERGYLWWLRLFADIALQKRCTVAQSVFLIEEIDVCVFGCLCFSLVPLKVVLTLEWFAMFRKSLFSIVFYNSKCYVEFLFFENVSHSQLKQFILSIVYSGGRRFSKVSPFKNTVRYDNSLFDSTSFIFYVPVPSKLIECLS